MILTDDELATVQRGQEMYETFFYELAKGPRVRYSFRTPDGTLFTTIAKTLGEARARRDRWLESRKIGATA